MNIKTAFVYRPAKQHGPLAYKTEIAAKGEIGKGITNQQKTEKQYGQPEQQQDAVANGLLNGYPACVDRHRHRFAVGCPPLPTAYKYLLDHC